MKKLIVSLLALMLMASLACGALAYYGTMYVNRSSVNVYKEDNTNSKVILKYKGGRSVFVSDISPNGKWAQILVEDTKHGGQMVGFIQTKYLSEKMPRNTANTNGASGRSPRRPPAPRRASVSAPARSAARSRRRP